MTKNQIEIKHSTVAIKPLNFHLFPNNIKHRISTYIDGRHPFSFTTTNIKKHLTSATVLRLESTSKPPP